MKSKTVIFANITYKPFYGGIENSFYYMSQSAVKKGYSAVIFVSDSSGNKNRRLKKRDKEGQVEIIRFRRIRAWGPFVPFVYLFSSYIGFLSLKKQYTVNTPLIIRSHFLTYAAYLAGFKNIVYLVPSMVKGLDDRSDNKVVGFVAKLNNIVLKANICMLSWLQNKAVEKCTRCCVFSANMKRQISNIVDGKNISIVKPGVETDVFRFDKQIRKARKKEYGMNNFVFLCIGRIIEAKGFEDVIRAYEILPELVKSNSKILIVGDGPDKERLITIVKQRKLEQGVTFLTSTDNPSEIYNLSDCFMMTSRYEAFGQTILEAMASGLPVVGYKSDEKEIVTATEEIVKDGENGLLCNFDVVELSKSMEAIYNSSADELEKYAMNNVCKVNSDFSWNQLIDNLLLNEND